MLLGTNSLLKESKKMKKIYKVKPLKAYQKSSISFRYWLIAISIFLLIALIGAISLKPKNLTDEARSDKNEQTESEPEGPNETSNLEEKIPTKLLAPSKVAGSYLVTKVVDGDTLDIDKNGETVRIRLIGVNTPETKHPSKPQECFGIEASNYLKQKLESKNVLIELDESQGLTDDYGRLLAYVYTDGKMINYSLIYDGYAYEYTYDIPYKYQTEFMLAQNDAAENNRGLWSPLTCNGQK